MNYPRGFIPVISRKKTPLSAGGFLKTGLLMTLLVLSLLSAPPAVKARSERPLPFYPGEKLTFELRWTVIPAGTAVLEVMPFVTIDDQAAYHFVLTAKSNDFIDNFYKVRDRIDAFADTRMTRTLFYTKKQREGKTKRDVQVVFDWDKKIAQYSNGGNKRPPIPLEDGAFDPLSAFYYSRRFPFSKNDLIVRPVTDGKKIVLGKLRVVKREYIKIKAGRFDTFLLEPDIEHIGGVFEKSKNAKISLWITADPRHLPVKIKSRVVVGSFVGELVSADGI